IQHILSSLSQFGLGFSISNQQLAIAVYENIYSCLELQSINFIRGITFCNIIAGRDIIVIKFWHFAVIYTSIRIDTVRSVRMINGLKHTGIPVLKLIAKIRISLVQRTYGNR